MSLPARPDPGPWLVVGLGNPGPEYAGHRHNAGFMVVDLMAKRMGCGFARHRKAVALVAEGHLGIGGPRVVLAKPGTFMNLSGSAAASLCQFFKIQPANVVAVHDELDLPYGQIRLKRGGGEGGHNGLRSLSASLGTRDYLRVRFGIGRPPGRKDPADFVLSNFSSSEGTELAFLIDRAADATGAVIEQGLDQAQNTFHPASS